MSRKKKLLVNTTSSIALQAVTAIAGLILPKLFIESFGSDINGLYHSIAKFLSMITLMEFGVGAVVQSALYKPLAEANRYDIDCIITSGTKFYRKLVQALTIYVVALIIYFNVTLQDKYSCIMIIILVLGISIGSFARYFFGAIDIALLSADQRGYIYYIVQCITLILNLIVVAALIKCGFEIHIVCLGSSAVYLLRTVVVRIYVNKHYTLNRNEKYNREPIAQKWNGIAQHFAYVVLEEADTIILTMFSTLVNVSIYSIYNGIVMGMKQLIGGFTRGVQSLMGDMIAKNESEHLIRLFTTVEFVMHMVSVWIYSCVGILIVPFVAVYTKGVSDADYIQPEFAILLVLAYSIHTLRVPYNTAILAAGHYKQTQKCYVIAAAMNVMISVIMVKLFGLVGVAIGTLLAMTYQTAWMLHYTVKNIIKISIKYSIKQIFVDFMATVVIVVATSGIHIDSLTAIAWIIMAIKITIISLIVIVLFAFVFYRNQLKIMKKIIKGRTI